MKFISSTLGCVEVRTQAEVSAVCTQIVPGVEEIRITLSQDSESYMPETELCAQFPARDIQNYWQPGAGRNKGLEVDWGAGFESKATTFAPVGCLYNIRQENRLTAAVSETVEPVRLKMGIREEDATISVRVRMFHQLVKPVKTVSFVLRTDTRPVPYYTALADVSSWWETFPACCPAEVPALAKEAMYSTWYSFHQLLKADAIEEQCRTAREFGCRSVIVDDGWQTEDAGRGYAYCGDWEVCESKMGDMAAHVARVHELGMKYILWYSVPFVGIYSEAYKKFHDKFLYQKPGQERAVLDPRFPEVREYLIGIYKNALLNWDLDGFKLDFVDNIVFIPGLSAESKPGQDYISVQEAVDRLLTDIISTLKAIKPDIMIEFRQNYIGPCMRKYGNMFRVGDCPNDSLTNRMGTLDLRLLSGKTAVHSDMLMWNPEEPVESAALQLINILFSVPQFSMDLTVLSEKHLAMSRFWLSYMEENRGVLLDGKLRPIEPESLYPLVYAETPEKLIAAVYQNRVVPIADSFPVIDLVNGAMTEEIVVKCRTSLGTRRMVVRSCTGEVVSVSEITLSAGLHALSVPRSGLISLL